MESLEERLRSLEQLIKTSVAARMPETTQERPGALTPSSIPSTASSVEQNLFASDALQPDISLSNIRSNSGTSPTLLQDLHLDPSGTSDPDFPPSTDESQGWATPEATMFYGLTAPALATTDAEMMPQTRYNGPKRCSLPPVQGGMFLLQEFLVDFNTAIPIFDASVITSLFQRSYDNMAAGVAIEWVALKVVLAIAHRLRSMSPMGVPQDAENASIYLQESLEVVPELLMLRPSPLLAQCFLGMASVISTSSRPYPAQVFVSLALRVIQDLHVNDPRRPGLIDTPELLQQQRVFWVAFFMDTDMAVRAGRLPGLSPRLINVPLPSDEDPAGEIAAEGGQFKANVFRLHVELALLQAEFMEQVLLPPGGRSSESLEDAELRSINARLEDWRRNWLFELDAQDLRTALHRSDLVHVVLLESTYFSTAYAFRAYIAPAARTCHNLFSAEGLMERMTKQKVQILYKDARRFIDLLGLIPGGDIASNWLSLETIVSALVVVLAHIIFNPTDESSVLDLGVGRHMLQILQELSNISKDDSLLAVQRLCVNLYRRAERTLQGENPIRR
ncbi:hypothetical protein G647_04533 [Cladophialophora carrionii CBS 160.54]|uniref:Xylanolytic transcriptional activator regulatory domain-containing protein n=1 Tax=Cladophialophora carrionii CBS 160.54 TaxID=1279043 RepID=V9DE83_9EURO|nr:uncharacterized protein G647_04533 [Cladophialophora carrionii CBS 160.54]ETI25160.1 hypothetical protein G647_04533 [Cladophialophora carrionii CBS 160.54]